MTTSKQGEPIKEKGKRYYYSFYASASALGGYGTTKTRADAERAIEKARAETGEPELSYFIGVKSNDE